MKKIKYNNKGITLIELLIVLAIMGIILQVIYSVFFVGNKSFIIGKEKGFAQQDARLIAEIVTKELRTAKEVSIDLSTISGNYYFLEFDKDNSRLIKQDKDKDKPPMIVAEGSIEKLSFNRDTEDTSGVISVTIIVKENNQSFSLDFDILLENLTDFNQIISDSNKIYYTKYD